MNWRKNHKTVPYAAIRNSIVKIFNKNECVYGYRTMTDALHAEGILINHKTVLRLMNELNVHPVYKHTAKYKSYKGEVGKVAPNYLDRKFDAKRPDTVWSTDVTEFKTPEGKVYLSPIKDFCTGEIVSYTYSASSNLDMVLTMMKRAITVQPCATDLLVHSDQGWQYQYKSYVALLKNNDIIQSMSRKGNCIDNCKMESFFGTMKNEMYCGHEHKYKTRQDLYDAIDHYIAFYNSRRIQHKLNGLPPLIFRQQAA